MWISPGPSERNERRTVSPFRTSTSATSPSAPPLGTAIDWYRGFGVGRGAVVVERCSPVSLACSGVGAGSGAGVGRRSRKASTATAVPAAMSPMRRVFDMGCFLLYERVRARHPRAPRRHRWRGGGPRPARCRATPFGVLRKIGVRTTTVAGRVAGGEESLEELLGGVERHQRTGGPSPGGAEAGPGGGFAPLPAHEGGERAGERDHEKHGDDRGGGAYVGMSLAGQRAGGARPVADGVAELMHGESADAEQRYHAKERRPIAHASRVAGERAALLLGARPGRNAREAPGGASRGTWLNGSAAGMRPHEGSSRRDQSQPRESPTVPWCGLRQTVQQLA